jgi:hypothetical protein
MGIYENAYVGVDPATVWQSPPSNTTAEIEKLKAQGMLAVDSNGEPVEEVEDESEASAETDEVDADTSTETDEATEGDGNIEAQDVEVNDSFDGPVAPVAPESDDSTIVQPLL